MEVNIFNLIINIYIYIATVIVAVIAFTKL